MDTDFPVLSGRFFFVLHVSRGGARYRRKDDPMEEQTLGGNSDTTPPLTFESAYAADTSPVSDPSTEQSTPPAAEQQGSVQDPKPQTTDDRSAYIPRSRFDEVNTRMTAAEARAQKLAWAEQIDQKTLNDAIGFYGQYKGDAVDFIQQLISQAQADPVQSAKLRSIAARTMSQGRQQQAPPVVDMTPTSVQLEDGTVRQLYSAEQMAVREQQLEARMAERFAPAMSAAEKLAQTERTNEANAFASDFLKDVRSLPNFTDVEPQIKQDLAAMIQAGQVGDHPKELENAVRSLYLKHGLSKLTARAQSSHLDHLQKLATASTGINPGSVSPTSPKRPKSFSDPSLTW